MITSSRSWRMRYGRRERQGETGETGDKVNTGGKGDTGLTVSTVLRHEIKPKMGEISNS